MGAEEVGSKKYKAYERKLEQYHDELAQLDDLAARKAREAVAAKATSPDESSGGKMPAWKLRLQAQTGGGGGATTPAPAPTRASAPTPTPPESPTKLNNSGSTTMSKKKEILMLKKKIQKVEKMIDDAVFGSKQYNQYYAKQKKYEKELEELEGGGNSDSGATSEDDASSDDDEDDDSTDRRREEEQRKADAEEARRQQVLDREEAERKRKAEQERRRKEREEAEEAERQRREEEEEEAERQRRAAEESEMDEKERLRKQKVEEFRRQREEAKAAKEAEEKAAKEKAARHKEYITFKKKLEKLDEMVEELYDKKDTREEAESTDKYKKLMKKKEEYLDHLDQYDEWWPAELEKREAEERRKEEARIRAEEERIRLQEERERRERERLEEEERLERDRLEEEERVERERIEAEERAEREAQEAAERAEREAREAEERAEREAQRRAEAEEHARKEEEERLAREKEREEREAARKAECEFKGIPYTPENQMVSKDFLDRRALQEPYSENTKKILRALENQENRHDRLIKTLNQNGIPVSEEIPYEVAKDKIAELTDKMKSLQASGEDEFTMQKKYYALEEEMSKYTTALMLTDEWAEEQQLAEEKWEESIYEDNMVALRKLRSHMPVNIRNMTEEQLTTQESPNGKLLPKGHAKKFKRTNVLQLLRTKPSELERTHPSLLEGMRTTGLTLTERRALYEHLKGVGRKWESMKADKSIERKWLWHQGLKAKFKESLSAYDRHVKEYGPPDNHPYAKRNDPASGGCPMLGNQCPVKADATISYDEDYGFTQEAEYEKSEATKSKLMDDSNHSTGASTPSRRKSTLTAMSASSARAKDEQLRTSIREKIGLYDPESDVDSKLLRELFHAEKRSASLEKQLTQNGLSIPKEEVSFAVAKERVAELTEELKGIAQQMGAAIDGKETIQLQNQYGKVADELEKFNSAMMLTKEWAAEQAEKERQWETSVRPDNIVAIEKIRRHMPVDIRDMSEEELTEIPTPNGQLLPKKIVRKFKRTNILMLLRIDPKAIEPMHPSSLEGMRTTGLTLTERRALHEHLKDLGPKWRTMTSDKMSERKWMWFESLRSKYKELVDKYQQHIDQYGPPGNHEGCPLLGNQCPIKADAAIDYSGDYGFPEGPEYLVDRVRKSTLLSMEDLERRSDDDDDGGTGFSFRYKEQEPEPEEPKKRVPMRMKSGIMRGIHNQAPREDRSPKRKAPSGLMAAIAAKADGGGNMLPAAPAGLLSAIAAKGNGGDDGDVAMKSPGEKKRRGGLLAAITSRGKK